MQSRSSECTRAGEAPIGRFRRGPPSLSSHWPTTPAQQGREAPQPWEAGEALFTLPHRAQGCSRGPRFLLGGRGAKLRKGLLAFLWTLGLPPLNVL